MLYFINEIQAYDVRWINVETKNGVTYLPIYYIACIKPE